MKLKMFSIYDAKAEAYMRPFFAPTNAAAIRSITDAANDNTHPIGQHPEDYSLFVIAEFDESNAKLEVTSPMILGVCHEFVTQLDAFRDASLLQEQAS